MNTDQFRAVLDLGRDGGLRTGAVYTPGGSLVASFAQESVIGPFA